MSKPQKCPECGNKYIHFDYHWTGCPANPDVNKKSSEAETALEMLDHIRKCKCERCPKGHSQTETGCPMCDFAHGGYRWFTNTEVLTLVQTLLDKLLEGADYDVCRGAVPVEHIIKTLEGK